MLDVRLPRFNRWLRDRGFGDGFGMGIGLNTGPFISGNVGSARRGGSSTRSTATPWTPPRGWRG